jgi:hypothetical protein
MPHTIERSAGTILTVTRWKRYDAASRAPSPTGGTARREVAIGKAASEHRCRRSSTCLGAESQALAGSSRVSLWAASPPRHLHRKSSPSKQGAPRCELSHGYRRREARRSPADADDTAPRLTDVLRRCRITPRVRPIRAPDRRLGEGELVTAKRGPHRSLTFTLSLCELLRSGFFAE